MTMVRTIACLAADELERSIVAGAVDDSLRRHLDTCPTCRDLDRLIRENLAFMGRLLDELGAGAAALPKPALASDSLPGYRLDREIARGGQGVVYEATQLETKRRVAIKMIEPGPASRRGRRRIEREAEISASLRHPNIVTVFDSAPLADGRYAIAMEFLEGVTLDEWARRVDASAAGDRASLREAVRIKLRAAAAVCDAVQFAHQRGVIHRDLKPANVVVNDMGIPQVVDFGIARRTTPEEGITRAGEFAGTLAYASPEQVSGDPDGVDTRSDIYSLGVILYEMLAGRRPYETERSLTGAIANITRTAPKALASIEPGAQPAGDELETILRKALAKDREVRYQTAGELRADIENLLAGRAVEAKRASALYVLRKTAARHRVACSVAAGFLILLASFAIAMAWSARKLDHQRNLLARSLASSTIERGRLLGLDNASARAEELIWPELIRSGGNPADPDLGFNSSPEVTQAAWALFELYSRSPSLNRITIAPDARAIAFEPDGSSVRIVRAHGAQECLNIADGRISDASPSVLESPIIGCCVSVPHNFAAATTADAVELLALRTGLRRTLADPLLKDLRLAQPSSDGNYLSTISRNGTLRLWRTQPLEQVALLAEDVSEESFGQFSADETLFVAGNRNAIGMWNPRDGSLIRRYPIPTKLLDPTIRYVASFVRLSPDNRWLAAGFSTSILLYRVNEPDVPPLHLTGHRGFVNWLDFSDDSTVLLSSGSERNFRTWDPQTGRLLGSFELGTACETVPAISCDGSLVAVADVKSQLRLWETRPRAWLTRLVEPRHSTLCVRFSPDGRSFAASAADGSVHAWRTGDHAHLWSRPPTGTACASLSYSPDSNTLAVASEGGTVEFVSAIDGATQAGSLHGPTFITWVGYSPDGRTIALAGSDARVYLHDVETKSPTGTLDGHTSRVVEAAFSPEGSALATAGSDGLAIVWDLASRSPRVRLTGHTAAIRAICFSPDGSTIATGSDDWTIRIWTTRSGHCEQILSDVKQHVFGLAFHPNGNMLFSCCRDPAVQIWDVRTGRELAILDGHDDMVLSLAISPDGRSLATVSGDRTVGYWNLAYFQPHVRGNAAAWMPKLPR